jgi:hypothetical protein
MILLSKGKFACFWFFRIQTKNYYRQKLTWRKIGTEKQEMEK